MRQGGDEERKSGMMAPRGKKEAVVAGFESL